MLPILEKKENAIINAIKDINSEEAFDPNNVKCAVLENLSKSSIYLENHSLIQKKEVKSLIILNN